MNDEVLMAVLCGAMAGAGAAVISMAVLLFGIGG
jgi:hypothetical protein